MINKKEKDMIRNTILASLRDVGLSDIEMAQILLHAAGMRLCTSYINHDNPMKNIREELDLIMRVCESTVCKFKEEERKEKKGISFDFMIKDDLTNARICPKCDRDMSEGLRSYLCEACGYKERK